MTFLHSLMCFILIFSGFLVAFSVNPIQSVLFLIATFCSAGTILMLFHSEFFGLIFVIVYVGAIAVLFLFVIMMLNVKNAQQDSLFSSTKKTEIFIIGALSYFIFSVLYTNIPKIFYKEGFYLNIDERFYIYDQLNNIEILGQSLYNYYFVCFLLAGLILLVALLGSVVLTLKFGEVKKSQIASKQLSRSDKFLSFFD